MYSYEYGYDMLEELEMALATSAVTTIPSTLFSIAVYVLTALALYTIAKRRGLNHAWLAWIPMINCWILGSLSDQYRYVARGENKSKRKSLLILNILTVVLSVAVVVCAVVVVVQAVIGVMDDVSETALLEMIMGPIIGMLGLCLPMIGVAIAYAIIRYMALYDIYKSLDPSNCVLFLVLSILFSVTEPFFLFFNRNKDLGMPPRRHYMPAHEEQTWQTQQAADQPRQPAQDPWENDRKDYL